MGKEIFVLRAEEKQNPKINTVITAVAAVCEALLFLSGAAALLGTLLPGGGTGLFFVVSAGTAVLVILSQQKKTWEMVLPFLLLFLAFFLLFFRMEAVIQGLLAVADTVLQNWNERFGTYLPLYGGTAAAETFFPAVSTVGLLFGLFTGYAVWRQWRGALTAAMLLSLAVGALAGEGLTVWPVIFLFAGWLVVWTGSRHNSMISLSVFVFVLLTGWGGAVLLSGFTPSFAVNAVRHQIERTVHRCRYGKDSLPKGELSRAGSLYGKKEKDREKTTLELTFDRPEELYLRGFVGADYDGKSWRQFSSETYTGKQEGMLDWLNREGYAPVFPAASLREAGAKSESFREEQEQEIRVVNKGADRCYVYVPETADSVQADYRENQDWQLLSGGFFGVRSYQFTDQSQAGEEFPETPDWTAAGDSAVSVACRQAEEVYRSFVYAHYLDVDETLRDTIERLFFSGEGWQQHTESDTVNIDDATARIRVMLAARARYKKETEEMPDGEDFVSWFLEEYREGNAVHFATAAVLAYRTLGVPARYVEGYYLNEDLAKQLEEEGADTCRLTGENAHAWAEIYIDGAGWSPVEVTPGFYRETYEPDYLIDVQEEEMEPTDRGTRVEADEIVPGAPERMKLPEIPELPWNLFGIFLFVLLILTGVGFLLELQRSLRITLFRRKWKKHPEKLAALTYRQMCRMLQYSGVQGDFRRPYELAEVICKRFPGIREEEYFRIIRIMQRNIFGQKPLRLNERRLLKDFLRKLQAEIRSKIPFSKKLLYRYLYCH